MPRLPITLAALALCLLGCETARDAELLDVSGVGPSWIEPGTPVRIDGRGFPAGRQATVRFDGRLARPGAAPREVHVRAAGQAVSGERVRLTAGPDLVRRLGGRGTFVGTVRVVFAGAEGLGTVSGALRDARLDFAPDTSVQFAQRNALEHGARAWLGQVGLEVDEETLAPDEGARLARVVPDGSAARAGLREGDRITEVEGLRPASVADLAPRPDAHEVRLSVARSGNADALTLRLPGPAPPGPEGAGMPFVVAALLGMLAFSGPGARIVGRLVRGIERTVVAGAGAAVPSREAARLVMLVPAALLLRWASDPTVAWAAYLACASAAWLLRARRDTAVRRARDLVSPLGFVACLGAVALLGGTPTASWPLALAHPVALVAFLMALRCAFGPPARGGLRSPAMWAEQSARALAAVLVVDRWLAYGPSDVHAVPWVWRLALAAVLAAGASAVQRRMPPPHARSVAALALGAVPALALGAAWLDPPVWGAEAFAPAALAVGLAVAAMGIVRGVRARRGHRPSPDLRLHPFL